MVGNRRNDGLDDFPVAGEIVYETIWNRKVYILTKITIRNAVPEDTGLILHLITELARFENAEQSVKATGDSLLESLFSDKATAKCLICMLGEKPIGFAVYFYNYSTWLGKNGIYLEDLYITPESRNSGAGKAVLKYLAQLAITEGCGRFEWSVLDWNEPAIKLYESIGAAPQNEWVLYRLEGDRLKEFSNN